METKIEEIGGSFSFCLEKEFIDNTLMGIALLQDGVIKYMNKIGLNITEYSKEFFLEKDSWFKIIHPDDLPVILKILEGNSKEASNLIRYKYKIVTKSGKERLIQIFSKKCIYFNRSAILLNFIDISDSLYVVEMFPILKGKLEIAEIVLKTLNIRYKIVTPKTHTTKLWKSLNKSRVKHQDNSFNNIHTENDNQTSAKLLDHNARRYWRKKFEKFQN